MATITHNDIALAIYSAAKEAKGKKLEDMLKQSVTMIADLGLLSESERIVSKVQSLHDAEHQITRAKIFSPRALEKKVKEELVNFLKNRYQSREVVVEEIIQPEIMGGLRIEVGDEVIDASLKRKVQHLHNHLIKS